jgi:calcium-dependent protein kinase
VKLENILFTQDESLHIKLIDFGSAIHFDKDSKSNNQNRVVTAYYVSPELINKQPNIEKCDVWSSGVILFIMLSGQPPFRGKDEQQILEKVVKA